MDEINEYDVHHTNKSQQYTKIPLKSIKVFVRQLAHKLLLSCTPVTLNQDQSQLDYYQNVEPNSIYHQTKFKSNPLINIQVHANVKVLYAVCKTAVISLVSKNLSQK